MSFVVAATGLRAEARIAERQGVRAIACGGHHGVLAESLRVAIAGSATAVLSFGIAGGLDDTLRPGDIVVAGTVVAPDGTVHDADPRWLESIASALPVRGRVGIVAGVDAATASVAAKAALRARTGALAVDMESHVAARIAAEHGLPFAAVRAVADPASRVLPAAALVGLRPDGSPDTPAVLRALAARPGEMIALIRVALDTRNALNALQRNPGLLRARPPRG